LVPLPVSGDFWVVEQLTSAPLVICLKADDPLADQSEIQPSELSGRLKIFRDPDVHPYAHNRLVEMLAEIGIQPEVTCLAATPADIQWMVRAGYGLALIDQKTDLDPSLTTRPIAGMQWTADTAFVYHRKAEHLALPILVRHLQKTKNRSFSKRLPRRREMHPLQLEFPA
jgi:DNA-binding transcriptional LysR family regulator